MGIIFHIWTVEVVDSVSCTRKNVFYTLPCLQYKLHGTFTNNNKGPIRLDNTITVPWGFMVYNNLVLGLHAQSQAATDHKSHAPKRSTSQHAEIILYSTMEGLVMSWLAVFSPEFLGRRAQIISVTTPLILNVVILSTKHLLHVYHCQQRVLRLSSMFTEFCSQSPDSS